MPIFSILIIYVYTGICDCLRLLNTVLKGRDLKDGDLEACAALGNKELFCGNILMNTLKRQTKART